MKKIIILFVGMFLFLQGLEIEGTETNSSNAENAYLHKILKKFSLDDDKETYLFTNHEVFNQKGQLLQVKNSSEYYANITDYTYNDNGKKIKEVSTNLFKPKHNATKLYAYDDKGVLEKITTLDNNDGVEYVQKMDNDENDNIKMEYNKKGKLIRKVEDTMSSSSHIQDSKLLEGTQYYAKKITTYHYDKAGNEIKQEFLDRYEKIDKQVYVYDKAWNLLSEKKTSDNNHTTKEHYVIYKEYDSKNNLMKEHTKVSKSVSACRGGLSYMTPNYDLVFTYDKENRVVKVDSTTRYVRSRNRVSSSRDRTDISYEYSDELLD